MDIQTQQSEKIDNTMRQLHEDRLINSVHVQSPEVNKYSVLLKKTHKDILSVKPVVNDTHHSINV
jgi:hypothetical protein